MSFDDTDRLCINAIRTLAIDAIQKANSGHPGLPMGAAPMSYVLWQRHLRFDASDPTWINRDRFVLSAGHGSMLLYALLHHYGLGLSLDEVKKFRQLGSKTPGHPEFGLTPGVDATTGPLGQGTANAVGMAMAERHLGALFNTETNALVDHYTYALVSDGDLMEGISYEAASLAGHHKLGKLIYLYDANDICLDGPVDQSFTESVEQRYQSAGWHVQTIEDGDHDLDGIDQAITAAKAESTKPSLIIVKTTIGYGSPTKAGSSSSHGSPLGADEIVATKKALGWPEDQAFMTPAEAKQRFAEAVGANAKSAWRGVEEAYLGQAPDQGKAWNQALAGELPAQWDSAMPNFDESSPMATRASGGQALNAVAQGVPWFFGGDADLSCSTKTAIKDTVLFSPNRPDGRNIQFGVREHAMGAIANGIAYHGGLRTFTATFFCFADYMRPAIRLAAMNHLPVTFVFTHDSVALGEDGPTHQPVEHLASLRAMPNCHVVRPADATEVAEAWRYAMTRTDGPTVLVLSRQNLPSLDRTALAPADGLTRGGYILSDCDGTPDVILMATGAEVHLALESSETLNEKGYRVRVVSMPCWATFDAQPEAYREKVLPAQVTKRIAIEAASSFGWARYVGLKGKVVGIDQFGASAPASDLMPHFGFTKENVVSLVVANSIDW